MPDSPIVAVVVPAFNEAAVIGTVLARIPSTIDDMTVVTVVVDDGSRDNTAGVALKYGATVLRHVTNLGVGAATITGLRAAQQLGAGIVVTMDADGQHDPTDIDRLVRSLVDG